MQERNQVPLKTGMTLHREEPQVSNNDDLADPSFGDPAPELSAFDGENSVAFTREPPTYHGRLNVTPDSFS